MTQTAQKTADIRYRVEIKNKPIVIYKVRSSDDTQTYDVTVVRGKVNNCTCKSYKPCYHMKGVQEREDERKSATVQLAADELVCTDPFVVHSGNVVERLSREAYTREFGIYQ